jgi:hypothetical protein
METSTAQEVYFILEANHLVLNICLLYFFTSKADRMLCWLKHLGLLFNSKFMQYMFTQKS